MSYRILDLPDLSHLELDYLCSCLSAFAGFFQCSASQHVSHLPIMVGKPSAASTPVLQHVRTNTSSEYLKGASTATCLEVAV